MTASAVDTCNSLAIWTAASRPASMSILKQLYHVIRTTINYLITASLHQQQYGKMHQAAMLVRCTAAQQSVRSAKCTLVNTSVLLAHLGLLAAECSFKAKTQSCTEFKRRFELESSLASAFVAVAWKRSSAVWSAAMFCCTFSCDSHRT